MKTSAAASRHVSSPEAVHPDSTDSDPLTIESYLFFWIGHLDALYTNRVRQALKHEQINTSGWRTLLILNGHGPRTTTELSQITVIERTALTRTIDQLQEAGLVERQASDSDRRSTTIEITREGVAVLNRARKHVMIAYRTAMQDVSRKDAAEAIALIRRIVRNLGGGGYRHIVEDLPE